MVLLKILWALPNTLLGLSIGAMGVATGGSVQRRGRVLEFYGGGVTWMIHRLPGGQFTLALTLGHVVLGQTAAALDISRSHESVHVAQYERWGPFFLPAYLIAGCIAVLRGQRFYRDNLFEREAYDADEGTGQSLDGH